MSHEKRRSSFSVGQAFVFLDFEVGVESRGGQRALLGESEAAIGRVGLVRNLHPMNASDDEFGSVRGDFHDFLELESIADGAFPDKGSDDFRMDEFGKTGGFKLGELQDSVPNIDGLSRGRPK